MTINTEDIQEQEMSEESSELNSTPGQWVKQLREAKGVDHAVVADKLHMTVTFVKALENDEYFRLPGKTFIKGYYKMYAEYLEANVDDILSCYEQHSKALEATEMSEAKVIQANKNHTKNVCWVVFAAFIIVSVGVLSWWLSYA